MFWKIVRIIFTVFLAATMAAAVFVPMAYDQRGCFAVGGEWLLVIGAGVLGWFYAKDETKNNQETK
jgi:hypothetical protein